MPTSVEHGESVAVEVTCSDHALTVVLDDGRTVSAPLAWFPRLLNATPQQRKAWEPIGGGIGMHWEEIDEDISVASLLQPEKFMRLANPYQSSPGQERRSSPSGRRVKKTRDRKQ